MSNIPEDMQIGVVHHTNLCGAIEILNYSSWDDVTIKFLLTGSIVKVRAEKIRNGAIKDPCKPSVYGIGFIGVGGFSGGTGTSGKHSRAYKIWHNMFKRCYSGKYPTYKDCTVHPDWHNFQNFAKWYGENYPNDGGLWDLDKDIKFNGNKVYGPENCIFVTPFENKSKAMSKVSRIKNPKGEVVEIYNLRKFCAENGLNYTSLNEVKLGRKKQHKGWTVAG